jgi:polyisoprenyl-phosphate glycosyltransferase
MSSISVIIPAYNEEKGIASVLERLKSIGAEVIVVDDGSTDSTGEVAKSHGAIVVRHPANGGYGQSLKSGIRKASNDLIAIADADGTYPVEELPKMVLMMEEGYDMVVGARQGVHYRGTFLKMPARIIFKFLVEFSTGRHIPDINSGLRMFRKSNVVPLFPLLCDTFSFTTSLTLAFCFMHKFIAYIPISYDKRVGKSKVRMVRDSLRTLQFIVQSIAHFNPLKLFLLMSSFLFVVAIGFVIAGVWVNSLMIALPAGPFFLGSIIVFALGIMADIWRMKRETISERRIPPPPQGELQKRRGVFSKIRQNQ